MKKFDDIYEIVHSECEQDLERTRNRTIVNTIIILGKILFLFVFIVFKYKIKFIIKQYTANIFI